MDKRFIYFDHAATTNVKSEVMEEMLPYFTTLYGNASTLYSLGRESKKAVDKARERVAKAIGAEVNEIYFTGSGTEGDNWAIKGIAYANRKKGKHIITTSIEHNAVLNTCKTLEKQGYEVTYLPINKEGFVLPDQVENAIKSDTILICIMSANNEIGTIQPISQIGEIAKKKGIYLHTDAVQAIGNIRVNVNDLNTDTLSMSAHKFYGPKGVGVLYIRKGTSISPILHGGSQERGRRASTENVPGIIGIGKAVEIAANNIESYSKKLLELRERTIDEILDKIPNAKLNGDRHNRLPGNVNFSFDSIDGESLLMMLDMEGIAASSASACASGSINPSHVILAMGLSTEMASNSLRLTFGHDNTHEDIDYLMKVLPKIINKLRKN